VLHVRYMVRLLMFVLVVKIFFHALGH